MTRADEETARPVARARIAWRSLAVAGTLFAIFAAALAYVQWGTASLADNDGYYHMKMGWLMRQGGLKLDFIWLPLSILSRAHFYNHHMLYQAYLGLFAGDGSPQAMILGAKVASVIMPSMAFLAIWWLLRAQSLPWASLWAIALCAISDAFLYRMNQPRAQSLALLIMALALHWLLVRRYYMLLPLGFVFVWAYNAFPLIIVLAVAYAVAALLTEGELAWRALLYPLIGVALGLLFNPYFPENISFIISHILPKVTDPTATSVGNEWYPYQTWTLVGNSGGALVAWVCGVFALGWRGRRFDRAQLTAFGLSVIFGYLLFKSRRFIEYFPPFALIFAALSLSPLLRDPPQLGPRVSAWLQTRLGRAAIPAALAALIIAMAAITLPNARAAMVDSKPAATYADASAWLIAHTAPGSMIFQTDWDDFPRLFFYNSANIYTTGLDPTYMELYDADLYRQWVDITRGNVSNPAELIGERFGAAYVISDLEHAGFMRKAAADPQMEEVYRDKFAVIYHIIGH
ncbi:MAG: hypothetical protein WCI67_16230 [Chloroflexales bacterium]